MVTTLPRGTGDITRTCTVRHICKAVHTPTRYTRIRANRDPVTCTCAPAALAVLVVSRRRVRSVRRNENTAFSRKKPGPLHISAACRVVRAARLSLSLSLAQCSRSRAPLSLHALSRAVSRVLSLRLRVSLSPSLRLYATPRISVRTPASERPESVQPPRQGVHRV